MQKYDGKSDIPSVDYVFAHDNFHVIRNYEIDRFSALLRINGKSDVVEQLIEVFHDGEIKDSYVYAERLWRDYKRGNRYPVSGNGTQNRRGTDGLDHRTGTEANGKPDFVRSGEDGGALTSGKLPGKFSLKKTVEETDRLIAVHNLTEKNLLDTIELGGFPMPSIAVVKSGAEHTRYGPISIVFGKDTIDPKAFRANKVYGGDAYTPTAPRVEYEADSREESRLSDMYQRLDDLRSGAVKNKAIYNGKDTFTPSGKRRSFSQLHDPYTLENIVKAMKYAQEERGALLGKDCLMPLTGLFPPIRDTPTAI